MVMPKHTVIASKTFRVLLQSTPFIYPPTLFSFEHRPHMILVEKYFPINYFACQKVSTPPLPNKKFPKKQDILALRFFRSKSTYKSLAAPHIESLRAQNVSSVISHALSNAVRG